MKKLTLILSLMSIFFSVQSFSTVIPSQDPVLVAPHFPPHHKVRNLA